MGSRLVVLTGCTRGLGRALLERFIEMGQLVHGCGRNAEQIAELTGRFGPPHGFAALDVRKDDAVCAWARSVLAAQGPPDLLVNNAALINRPQPLWSISAAEFDEIVDVNVKGVVNLIRHFVPAMIERKRGVIVNLSSGWGRSVAPEVAPYCATKFAVEGLTKALAEELPAGMAAVPLNPGIIDTDMLRTSWQDGASSYPPPEAWSRTAAPFILKLGPADSGKGLSVPSLSAW